LIDIKNQFGLIPISINLNKVASSVSEDLHVVSIRFGTVHSHVLSTMILPRLIVVSCSDSV
jgi:hypothetical protein